MVSFSLAKNIGENIRGYDNLQILYSGKVVDSLTITDILFWNSGAETITKQDIVLKDPLLIVFSNESNILNAEILKSNSKGSDFSCLVTSDRKKVEISFDYIDQNQGCIIRVFHTGIKSEINISGSLKGVNSVRIIPASTLVGRYGKVEAYLFSMLPTFGWGCIILSSIFIIVKLLNAPELNLGLLNGLAIWIGTLIFGVYSLYVYYSFDERRIPMGFDNFK